MKYMTYLMKTYNFSLIKISLLFSIYIKVFYIRAEAALK